MPMRRREEKMEVEVEVVDVEEAEVEVEEMAAIAGDDDALIDEKNELKSCASPVRPAADAESVSAAIARLE